MPHQRFQRFDYFIYSKVKKYICGNNEETGSLPQIHVC